MTLNNTNAISYHVMVWDQIINKCGVMVSLDLIVYGYMRLTQNYKLRDLIGIFFKNFQEFIEKYAQIIGL